MEVGDVTQINYLADGIFCYHDPLQLPVKADTLIGAGALVGVERTTGYAVPLVPGDTFAGVASRMADNTVEGNSGGTVGVWLHQYIDASFATTFRCERHVIGTDAVYVADTINGYELMPYHELRRKQDRQDLLRPPRLARTVIGKIIGVESLNKIRVRLQPWR